jgi:ribosomal protein S8
MQSIGMNYSAFWLNEIKKRYIGQLLEDAIASSDNGIVSTNNGIVSSDNGIVSTNNGIVSSDNGIVSTSNGIVSADNAIVLPSSLKVG